MPRTAIAAAVFGLLTGTSLAQTPPSTPNAPSNPAVNSSGPNNPGAPAAGANSFTEGQAKARLEARGFSDVSPLTKGSDGIWRGKATRNGQSVDVAVDYQGNIVAQ